MFNTRKTARQEQTGATVDQRLGADDHLRASLYAGDRQVRQFQAIPIPALPSRNDYSGGVVDLGTYFDGYSLNWIHDGSLFGRPLSVTSGLEQELTRQRRRGSDNNFGAVGALRRDEDDNVTSSNVFAQADWRFVERASATLRLRAGRGSDFTQRPLFRTGAAAQSSDHFQRPARFLSAAQSKVLADGTLLDDFKTTYFGMQPNLTLMCGFA